MAGFSGKFEYLAPGGAVVQAGGVELSFDAENLTLVGQGPAIAFDLGDIDLFEAAEYELRLVLADGHTVRLAQFGKSFQDLVRQVGEAYRNRLTRCLLVSDLDEVARYSGHVHLESASRRCDGPAEIRLYESNIAILPHAAVGFQWRLAEVEAAEFDESSYALVLVRRGERLSIGRLAKRTGELAERIRERVTALNERSARALRAVFPFLSSEQFRRVACLMREGGSAPIAQLRPIHRLIESSLLERVVDGALRPYLRELVGHGQPDAWHAGFKVVRREAEMEAEPGGEVAADPVEPGDGEGEATVVEEETAAEPAVLDAGDGLEVLFWFFVPMDGGRHVAWEATSRGGRATYVFRLPGCLPDEVARGLGDLNDGLVALNFRREPVYLKADTLESESRYRHYAVAARKLPELAAVRQAFVGRAIHRSLPAWRKQLGALLHV
jgi:hypothetical protein